MSKALFRMVLLAVALGLMVFGWETPTVSVGVTESPTSALPTTETPTTLPSLPIVRVTTTTRPVTVSSTTAATTSSTTPRAATTTCPPEVCQPQAAAVGYRTPDGDCVLTDLHGGAWAHLEPDPSCVGPSGHDQAD